MTDKAEENLMFEEVEDNEELDLETLDKAKDLVNKEEIRKIKVPFHRMNPLKKNWETIVKLVAEKMQL